jgi:hypothetical protein
MVSREPDIAILILDQPVRRGERRLERIFLYLAGLRIDPSEPVGHLAGIPDGTVPGGKRVVWPRARYWHLPLLDVDPRRPGDDVGHGLRLFREIRGQIIGDEIDLLGRNRDAEVEHHSDGGVPIRLRVT